jgi:hypothetical protein
MGVKVAVGSKSSEKLKIRVKNAYSDRIQESAIRISGSQSSVLESHWPLKVAIIVGIVRIPEVLGPL